MAYANPEDKRAYNRAYRAANRDRRAEYSRQWYAANRERARETGRQWREANPERIKENGRRWREANRERHNEKSRRYAAANPERVVESQRRSRDSLEGREARRRHEARRRARKLRATYIEHVDPLVVLELYDGVCGICGEDVDPFDYHVDHIVPLSKGGFHSLTNSQPAHPSCNLRKGSKSAPEVPAVK